MTKFSGKGVCGGIAIGKICLSRREKVPVKRMRVEDTSAELARFDAALSEADAALAAVYEKALVEVGESGAQIFEIHRMMLADEDY
ncbi:MAG: phosphoenolpyruvate--protein phosphotransferase, partial [Clostridia bacterium]|nr:phosphoenolpyruvate--protein phosphotransferase [Clostridia bacterium]